MTNEHVVIVGAGFSGTLMAINLLRHDGPRATLIERGPLAGEGLAYGAAHPSHLLNVRAGNMSALPDEPDHFVRWLERRGGIGGPATFVPRMTYGAYLREMLHQAVRASGDRLTVLQGEVVAARHQQGAYVVLADGRQIDADTVVLAVGNLPPHVPPGLGLERLSAGRYIADPWEFALSKKGSDSRDVLILGTGLTMVDVALRLQAEGHRGRIVALSRRGLLPHPHSGAGPAGRPIDVRPAPVASHLVAQVRARARSIGWRSAVDELRPFTQTIWRAASPEQRGRFLRHLRPWWDIHRHRLAPAVADRIARMIAEGQLSVGAGKLTSVEETPTGLTIGWRPRGESAVEHIAAQAIINCTGPQGDLLRTGDPLLGQLFRDGAIRPDICRIGIDVDPQSRTLAADGTPNDWLVALGPMTRGAFWEIVAVPDIRAQVWTLARRLSNAHWVSGEGL